MKKLSIAGSLAVLLLAVGNAPEAAAEVAKLPPSGTTHFTTYFAVHPAHELKMVDGSSITVAELVGITRNPDGEPYFDNLVVRCLVSIRVVKGEQDLYGACRETVRTAIIRRQPSIARRTILSAAPASTRG